MVSSTQIRRLGEQINDIEQRFAPTQPKLSVVTWPDELDKDEVIFKHWALNPHEANAETVVLLPCYRIASDYLRPSPRKADAAWREVAKDEVDCHGIDGAHQRWGNRLIQRALEKKSKGHYPDSSVAERNIAALVAGAVKHYGFTKAEVIQSLREGGINVDDPFVIEGFDGALEVHELEHMRHEDALAELERLEKLEKASNA